MKFKTLTLASALFVTTAVQAESSWLTANNAIVSDHILPRHQQLADASKTLEQQSKTFCESPTEESLDKTRQAFHQTMDGWIGIQHIRFGPVELLNRYHRFQLWPDKHNTGNKQIRKLLTKEDTEVLEEDNFSRTSVAIQGLSALERLLFAKDRSAKTFISEGKSNYRCQMVQAITHNVATMSAELVEDWSATPPPFHMLFLSSGEMLDDRMGDTHLGEKKEVAIGFFNNLYTQVQSVIDQKLVRPMGASSKKAKPRYLESWRSERSLRNIALNLQAVESLYDTGFAPLLKDKDNGTEINKQIKAAFKETYAAADVIEGSLYKTLNDEDARTAHEQLLNTTRKLQSLLTGPLPKALDIPLGFNALDGD